jgi:hypothetical protein
MWVSWKVLTETYYRPKWVRINNVVALKRGVFLLTVLGSGSTPLPPPMGMSDNVLWV